MLGLQVALAKVLAEVDLPTREVIERNIPPALVDTVVHLARPAKEEVAQRITPEAFISGMLAIPQSAFATVGHVTIAKDSELIKPKTLKTSGRIMKAGVSQLLVNVNYANLVNNKMGELCEVGETIADHFGEEFEAAPRQWGERVYVNNKPVGLVEHKGELYLETAFLRSLGPIYWYFDGKPVDYADIKAYFHPKRESDRQPLPEEMKIKWRTWKISSIQTVAITPNTTPRVTHRFTINH